MAGILVHGNSGEFALTAGVPQSACQVKSAANQRNVIRQIKLLGKMPAGGTDTPVKVRATYSSSNFGTFSGGVYAKIDQSTPENITATFGGRASVEPTSPTDLAMIWEFNPQIWTVEPWIKELSIPVPGGSSVQFELTSAATPTVAVEIFWEQ